MKQFKEHFFYFFYSLLFFSEISNAVLETRYISPPKLEDIYLGEKTVCYRPLRDGGPAMFIQESDNQLIVNNYGHGGSGWTLGPGASQYLVNNLQKKMLKEKYSISSPITIIGAGIIGLFTAFELLHQKFNNITIIAKEFEDLASHKAGGLLAPVSINTTPDMQDIINEMGIKAYKFYKDIADGKNPILKGGAKVMPVYFETPEKSGLESYVNIVMPPSKKVLLDFNNGTKREMIAYDQGIFIDTPGLMQTLRSYLTEKVTFIKRKIDHLDEIKTPIVINCTGLGAKELNNDTKLVPVQGHLILLKNQNPMDLNYITAFSFGNGKTSHNKDIKRFFYIMSKRLYGASLNDVGVIGGTFIENAGPETPHLEEFDTLIENARQFYGLV